MVQNQEEKDTVPWRHISATLALRKLKQEVHECQTSLGQVERKILYLKKYKFSENRKIERKK